VGAVSNCHRPQRRVRGRKSVWGSQEWLGQTGAPLLPLFLAGNEEKYEEEAEWEDVEEGEEGSGEEDQWKDEMGDEGGDKNDVAGAYPFTDY
jgi:hypothetical protein